MLKQDVRTTDQALAYLIDCTLATVTDMAMKKSRGKREFQRQISIAQTAILWARQFGVDLSSTRAKEVDEGLGGVALWAAKFMPENKVACKERSGK